MNNRTSILFLDLNCNTGSSFARKQLKINTQIDQEISASINKKLLNSVSQSSQSDKGQFLLNLCRTGRLNISCLSYFEPCVYSFL